MKQKTEKISFQFENKEAASHFWRWLCESGEQQYWEYMQYREQEEDGDITALHFEYDNADRGLVTARCGRFTDGQQEDE